MSSDLLHIRVHPTSPPFCPMPVKMLSAVVFSLAFAAVLGQDEGIRCGECIMEMHRFGFVIHLFPVPYGKLE